MNIEQKVLSDLKKEISQNEYQNYIKDKLTFDNKKSKNDVVYFYTPNIIIAKWVKTKYEKKLAHFFELYSGIKPKVIIDVKSDKNKLSSSLHKTQMIEKNSTPKSTFLNPSLIFDTFIVGKSNQFAYTAAKSVSEKLGSLYNPLFLYGGVGLGKTHLLQAIGNQAIAEGKSVIYTTLEAFLNTFTNHLRNLHIDPMTMEKFREKYRKCDLLLIDDIQFISRKEQTQEELFHTFNELHGANKQIVITADKAPNKIAGLADRLKTRFEWGLMADIQAPELETKIEIIKKKCQLNKIHLANDVINFIATNMGDNIREIEGVITKLNALSSILSQKITIEFARNTIKDQLKEKKENITIDAISHIISKELNIKPSDIKSKKRTQNIVNARRIIIYLARNLTPNSMPQIAMYFGMKDHTAISHAMRKISEMIENDENLKVFIEEMSNKISSSEN